MSMEKKIQELNKLMMEYSQLKDTSGNEARCFALKNRAVSIIYSSDFCNMLKAIAKKMLKGRFTRYQTDEFITETYIKYFDEYDYKISDNFYKYFLKYLSYTIGNLTKREHPESMPEIFDNAGNEILYTDLIEDDRPDIGTTMEVNLLFGENLSVEEAEIRERFLVYYSKLIPCVMKADEHRGNKKKYYSSFATDFYIASCKLKLHIDYQMNEQEAFHVMDLGFADFTLSQNCRSFKMIEKVPLKKYSEIGVDSRNFAGGEIETPFRNCVYSAFFDVSDGRISQYRKKFYGDIGLLVNEEE